MAYYPLMSGAEFKAAIKARGLDQKRAAAALGVTEAAVSLWVNGLRPISGPVQLALQTIPLVTGTRRAQKAARKTASR